MNSTIKSFLVIFFVSISSIKAQVTLTYLNKYTLTSVPEPSGLAFDKVNNQLFTVSDTGNIYRISTTGALLSTYVFPGDLEGVSMFNTPNTLLVAIEDTYKLVEYNYVTGTSVQHTMSYVNKNDSGSGIEGVTYDPIGNKIYFLNEKNPGALIVANSSFIVTNEYVLGFAGDYSASDYVPETGLLWLGSDQDSKVYICNTTGAVLQSIKITTNGLTTGPSLDKFEGMAIDYANQKLYVVTDGGQDLIVYQISGAVLATNETAAQAKIKLFPNPAKNEIFLSLQNIKGAQYSIHDLSGKMLLKGSIPENGKLNVEKLNNGNYIFTMILNNGDKIYEKLMIKK